MVWPITASESYVAESGQVKVDLRCDGAPFWFAEIYLLPGWNSPRLEN
jgi:hypothetical protein